MCLFYLPQVGQDASELAELLTIGEVPMESKTDGGGPEEVMVTTRAQSQVKAKEQ